MYTLDETDAALDLSHMQHIGTLFRTWFRGAQFVVISLKDCSRRRRCFSARDSATSSNELGRIAILVCMIMLSASGKRGRRVERQWVWVSRGGHCEVLYRETRVGSIYGMVHYVLVLLLYPWPVVVVEFRYLLVFL